MTNQTKFNALTPQQKAKFKKLRSEHPHMSFEEVYAKSRETKYVSKAQREAFNRIVIINRLQKPELIELAQDISRQAVQIAKDSGGTLDDLPTIVAEIIERAHYRLFMRMFVQAELQGVTLHTLSALEDKGVLEESKPYGDDGVVYWKLTGKELK